MPTLEDSDSSLRRQIQRLGREVEADEGAVDAAAAVAEVAVRMEDPARGDEEQELTLPSRRFATHVGAIDELEPTRQAQQMIAPARLSSMRRNSRLEQKRRALSQ